jgi:protein kinase A
VIGDGSSAQIYVASFKGTEQSQK